MLRELQSLRIGSLPVSARGDEDRLPFPLRKSRPDGVGQPISDLRRGFQPVHNHQESGDSGEVQPQGGHVLWVRNPKVDQLSIGQNPQEPHGTEVLHHQPMGHPLAQRQGEGDEETRVSRQGECPVHGAGNRVGPYLIPTVRTMGSSHSSPQETQVVEDLRGRPDRGPARFGRVLLFDGNRWSDTLDEIHQGLFHPVQKLLGIRGEGLHVSPLSLGEESIQGKGRLPGSGGPGDDRESPPGKIQVEVLQVMLPGAPDSDLLVHPSIIAEVSLPGYPGENQDPPHPKNGRTRSRAGGSTG